MSIKELLRDVRSDTYKYLSLMRDLALMTDTERKLYTESHWEYSLDNIDRLYNSAIKEVTNPEDLDQLDGLRKIYLEKWKYGYHYHSPYMKDIEEYVNYAT